MVGNDNDLFRIPNLIADIFHAFRNFDSGSQDIIHHGSVYVRPYDITGCYLRLSAGMCQNLFGNRFAHFAPPYFFRTDSLMYT